MNPFGDEPEATAQRIAWCVPSPRYVPPQDILLQTALVAVVPAAVLVAVRPGPEAANWIAAILVAAAIHALWRIADSYSRARNAPNLALDDNGLHWLSEHDQPCTIPAAGVRGFFIGLDPETSRRVPSLTLILGNGSLSQPIELHAPANEENITALLKERWKTLPFQKLPAPSTFPLRLGVSIVEEEALWHWEGPRSAMRELAAALAEIASRYEEPAPGIRPRTAVLQCEWSSPVVAVFPTCFIREQTLFASRAFLETTAQELGRHVNEAEEEFEMPLNLAGGREFLWTFQIIADETRPPAHS